MLDHYNSQSHNDDEQDTLVAVSIATASLSFVACAGLCAIIIWLRDLTDNQMPTKLVFALCIANVLQCVSRFFGDSYDGPSAGTNAACYAQAVIMQFGEISVIIWIAIIAFEMWQQVLLPLQREAKEKAKADLEQQHRSSEEQAEGDKGNNDHAMRNANRDFLRYCAVAVVTAMLLTLIPLIPETTYGDAGTWCWIDGRSELGNYYRWFAFYVIWWLVIIFLIFVYGSMYLHLRKHYGHVAREYHLEWYYKVVRQLAYYPIVLFVCFLPAQIYRINNSVTGDEPFGMGLCTIIFSNLNGLFNVMIYGMKDTLISDIKAKCCEQVPREQLEEGGGHELESN